MNKQSLIFLFLFLGFLIRIYFIFMPGFKFDIDAWFAWAIRLTDLGLPKFYSEAVWTHYTPGYLYFLLILGFLKNLFVWDNNLFYLILKIPPVIADLILAWIIYREVILKTNLRLALLAASLILFNPVTVFNSAVWGQIDGLLSLFLVSTIILLKKNKLVFSSIFFGLAVLIKPQSAALIPALLIFCLDNFSLNKFLKLTLPGLFTIFILSLPFFTSSPLLGIYQLIVQMSQDYTVSSLNAFNLWGVVGFWIPDKQQFLDLTLQNWGYLLLILYWLIIIFFYFKHKISPYVLASLGTLSFFFLPTRVHERYLYPAIPFLILVSFQAKSKTLVYLLILLSFIHFANLYYVYFLYDDKNIFTFWQMGYTLIVENAKALSLLSTLLFIIITITLIKNKNVQKLNA